MTHQSDLIERDIDAYLAQHEKKELLRFLTCGSVDDGKSTLIGRLFYDSKMIYEDQLAKLEKDSVSHGTTGGEFDPALYMDSLHEEIEQGITIDVAYRYFSTEKRKFIIADTPGHIQYTRNMATGASTADLAVILVDARNGVVEQTKRHTFIVNLLGIKHVMVAVNKMDLVDFDEEIYDKIQKEYRSFANRLDIPDLHFIPISALNGDNVVDRSENTPWYQGQSLLAFLNSVYIGSDRNLQDFRFPVQIVNRPNLNFRGYAGTISSGIVRKGDEIMVLPSRKTSKIKDIVAYDGNLEEAHAPMSITLTFEDEIGCSRGDMVVRPGNIPKLEQKLDAMIVWMSEEPLLPGKQYLFKQTTNTTTGQISTLRYQVDVNTLGRKETPSLKLNEIGRCGIQLDQPMAFDGYRRNRGCGSFIIIDRISNITVGAGMILDRQTSETKRDHWEEDPSIQTLSSKTSEVSLEEREARFGQQAATLLLTGYPGAGKTTTAYAVERHLFELGHTAIVLDGQNLRLGLNRDLSFTNEGRSENLRRTSDVANILNKNGIICLMSMVAPSAEIRGKAYSVVGKEKFLVVHLNTPKEICEQRQNSEKFDENNEVPSNYEPPQSPDLTIDTSNLSTVQCVEQIVKLLQDRGFVPAS